VEVRDLKDLEFAVFVDAKYRCFNGGWGTATNTEAGFLVIARVGEEESLVTDFPARSGFFGVSTEENVYCCDCFLGVGGMPCR